MGSPDVGCHYLSGKGVSLVSVLRLSVLYFVFVLFFFNVFGFKCFKKVCSVNKTTHNSSHVYLV